MPAQHTQFLLHRLVVGQATFLHPLMTRSIKCSCPKITQRYTLSVPQEVLIIPVLLLIYQLKSSSLNVWRSSCWLGQTYYSNPKPTEVVRKTNSAKDSKLFCPVNRDASNEAMSPGQAQWHTLRGALPIHNHRETSVLRPTWLPPTLVTPTAAVDTTTQEHFMDDRSSRNLVTCEKSPWEKWTPPPQTGKDASSDYLLQTVKMRNECSKHKQARLQITC